MKRTILALALVGLMGSPALAGDYPWSYHSGGKHSTSRSYRSAVPPGIVGGRSVTSDRYRPYRHRDYRSYGRGGDTIIIIERDGYRGLRW